MSTINERIRELRQYNDLTQKEFAQKIGISREYLCRLEAGNEKPVEKMLLLISVMFQVNYNWLLDGTGAMIRSDEISLVSRIHDTVDNLEKRINMGDPIKQDYMISCVHSLSQIWDNVSSDSESLVIVEEMLTTVADITKLCKQFSDTHSFKAFSKLENCKKRLYEDIMVLCGIDIENDT